MYLSTRLLGMVMMVLISHQQVLHNLGVSKVSVPQHKDLTMRTSHLVLKSMAQDHELCHWFVIPFGC